MRQDSNRIAEVGERIRLELNELMRKREELDALKSGLTAYIDHLRRLLGDTREASSSATLEKVKRLGEIEVKTKSSLFKMSKYFIEKKLIEKLELAKLELGDVLSEIKSIEDKNRDVNLCPECRGEGKKKSTEIVREDRIVRRVLKVSKCSLCEGKGRIDLDLTIGEPT